MCIKKSESWATSAGTARVHIVLSRDSMIPALVGGSIKIDNWCVEGPVENTDSSLQFFRLVEDKAH